MPLLSKELRARVSELKRARIVVSGFGVPSHGKVKKGWTPHQGATEAQVRAWNAAADRAAADASKRAAAVSGRLEWCTQRNFAFQWEVCAIRAAAVAMSAYRDFLSNL